MLVVMLQKKEKKQWEAIDRKLSFNLSTISPCGVSLKVSLSEKAFPDDEVCGIRSTYPSFKQVQVPKQTQCITGP
jgi:hypothetical protein